MEQIIYDEPEFIVRNIWRLEGGWHNGVPSHLKPASEAAQAREFAIASHLIDLAVAAASDDKAAQVARTKIYAARAVDSRSTMAHGIFRPRRSNRRLKRVLHRPRITAGFRVVFPSK
jgi:alkyl sulfatase-like protein